MTSSVAKPVSLIQSNNMIEKKHYESSSSTLAVESKDHFQQSRPRVTSSGGLSQITRAKRNVHMIAQNKDKIIEVNEIPRPKPISYCVNINQDGARTMDKVSHLNAEQINNETLEHSLRPISGIRNYIKRNLISTQSEADMIHDDIVKRIGSVKTLKRLDLSNNFLRKYPPQLCDLNLLEILNLTGNNIDETVLPDEVAKYDNLIELVLDSNKFKKLPKCIAKLKKLTRLSICNNMITDIKNVYHLKKLKYLVLDNNNLTELDEKLKNLEKLEILHLNHNLITNLDSNLLKQSLNFLKQLDLSSNKLNTIAIEVFTMPSLEILNLSNNKLTKLPVVPPNNYRSHPLFVCDISSNSLTRFYEFLIMIAKNIDLSSNCIKAVPSRLIDRLSLSQMESKVLKLDNNPIVNPPIDVCKQGLKILKEWFEEEAKKIQLNKGFKILLFGDLNSGKTTLANALEDFNSQSNLIEQMEIKSDKTESKFIEIRDFYMNNEHNSSDEDDEDDTEDTNIMRTVSRNIEIIESTPLPTSRLQRKISGRQSSARSRDSNSNSTSSAASINNRPKTVATTINAFSNINLTEDKLNKINNYTKSSRMNVHIYDFNGSISQFSHLIHLIMDKTALIVICIDSSDIELDETNKESNWNIYLKQLLDLIILKMNKTTNYYLLFVLTKSDKILKLSSKLNQENISLNKQIIEKATSIIEKFVNNHIESKLSDIRDELKKIESLTKITTCHSDRLKQLVQIQANIRPQIHKLYHVVSSLKMDGIELLSKDILNTVTNLKKQFPFVNDKVPTFWYEVEKYVCNNMSQLYLSKASINKSFYQMRSMSMLCVDFDYFKDKIIEKYGMSHLIESITKYLSSSGKIIWFQDTEKLRQKVYLKPSLLFDLLFALFRTNFIENFNESKSQSKYSFNLSDELMSKYSNDLLSKGHLNLDLLKTLWYPILQVESSDVLQNVFIQLSYLFNIGYPELSKDKLKQLYAYKSDDIDPKPLFNNLIIPFYLPNLNDLNQLDKIRTDLNQLCFKAISEAVNKLKIKTEMPKLMSKLSQKYTFPWDIKMGIFERFSNHLLINTELYFKIHCKNFIYALNQENSIGVLIYKNIKKDEIDQVIFEFYIISYHQVIESLNENKINKDEQFEQTLTMDLDQLWLLGLRVLQLFEDIINSSYPNLRFDRFSICPECEKYSFIGEWLSPKELQKNKYKNCSNCEKLIEYTFLVKPATGQNPTLDQKKLKQRLEDLAQTEIRKSQTNIANASLPEKAKNSK